MTFTKWDRRIMFMLLGYTAAYVTLLWFRQ